MLQFNSDKLDNNRYISTLKGVGNKIGLQNGTLITFMLLITIITAANFDLFLTGANIEVLCMNFLFNAFAALGMTFVIITGGIDLSVATVIPFAEIIVAKLMVNQGLPMVPAIAITLLCSAFIGLLNGWMVNYLDVHPMIITMGMMMFLKGFNLATTEGKAISGFSESFLFLSNGHFLGINIAIWIFIILAIVLGYLLKKQKFCKLVYYIGGNEKAAKLSGVNVKRVKYYIYTQSAVLAGIAGILAASRYGAAHWSHGVGTELKAIAAVAVGGASLNGGSGSIGATVLGCVFLALVHNAFIMAGINTFWYDVVNGGLLLLAVFFSILVENQRKELLIKNRMKN